MRVKSTSQVCRQIHSCACRLLPSHIPAEVFSLSLFVQKLDPNPQVTSLWFSLFLFSEIPSVSQWLPGLRSPGRKMGGLPAGTAPCPLESMSLRGVTPKHAGRQPLGQSVTTVPGLGCLWSHGSPWLWQGRTHGARATWRDSERGPVVWFWPKSWPLWAMWPYNIITVIILCHIIIYHIIVHQCYHMLI